MKKAILIILTIITCLSVAASLSACKKKNTSESETAGQESVEQSKENSEKQSEGKSESETAATSESVADNSESESNGESESVSESESVEESEEEREIVYTEGLEYELTADGKSYAIKGAGTFTGSELNIPSEHDGKPVTSILSLAFTNNTGITSICIPDTITTIEENSFDHYCELSGIYYEGDIASWCSIRGLENLPLFQTFRNLYFKGKELKGTLTIPQEVSVINAAAFAACDGITELVIAEGVTEIGFGAFLGCKEITDITISNSVAKISTLAFTSCFALKNLTIGSGIKTIEESAFTSCFNLTNVYYVGDLASWCKIDGLANITTTANIYIDGKEIAGDLIIPDTVTEIKEGAFYFRTKITSVTIPESVTTIGDRAFYYCVRLSTVTMGNGVTSIGSNAFYQCVRLTNVAIGNNVTKIGGSAFMGCGKLASIKYSGTKEKWYAISKSSDWNTYTGNYVVHCTDGDINKN